MSPRRRLRLDLLMVENGFAVTVEEAQALVMAGDVSLPGRQGRPTPGQQVRHDQEIAIRPRRPYVSRGGEKLAYALDRFGVDPAGITVLDVGASTGGFTDCLLQRGARRVYAVDVGHGQLHSRLVADDRVVSMEGVNARDPFELPVELTGEVDLVVADVSFISLRVVLPQAFLHLPPRGQLPGAQSPQGQPPQGQSPDGRFRRGRAIVLFKPQFEARRDEVPRGGVIRDPALRARLIGRFVAWLTANGIRIRGLVRSPILGDAGNAEFLFWLEPPGRS
ncbi:MAG: TlyA family RNA methyltransferase [Chloroflexi bacterium]|nr:TlyA family RNA methyltransferase [Chloroflexota bacterium]